VTAPTPEQALARATIRRWQQAGFRAFEDATYRGYVDRLVTSYDDPDEYQAILAEMSAYLAERAPELVEGPVDTETLTLIAGKPDSDSESHMTWLQAIGERLGQQPLEPRAGGYLFPTHADWATETIVGMVRLEDDRLEIGSTSFVRFSTGGLQLLAYLVENGCSDVRFRLLGNDELGGG
jgi:hypothetical protein